jgi:hypothetical protein
MAGSVFIVCRTDRPQDFSELLESRGMIKWKMAPRSGFKKGLLDVSDTSKDKISTRC